jgi:DNA-directed RNA polymerase sigma subunit (sigma70/sigma32)
LSTTSKHEPEIPDFKNQYETADERLRAMVVWTAENCPYRQYTLGEIGDAAGLTRERIRQIQLKAERRFRYFFGKILKAEGIDPTTLLP